MCGTVGAPERLFTRRRGSWISSSVFFLLLLLLFPFSQMNSACSFLSLSPPLNQVLYRVSNHPECVSILTMGISNQRSTCYSNSKAPSKWMVGAGRRYGVPSKVLVNEAQEEMTIWKHHRSSLSGKRPLTLRPRVARCSCLHIWLTQQILAFTHIIFLNVSSYF